MLAAGATGLVSTSEARETRAMCVIPGRRPMGGGIPGTGRTKSISKRTSKDSHPVA